MAQYMAFDSNVEIVGRTILATIDGLGDEALAVFLQHGIADIDVDGWYPQQMWLDVLRSCLKRVDCRPKAGDSWRCEQPTSLPNRYDRQSMGCYQRTDTTAKAGRTSPDARHATGHQRDFLPGGGRCPMADAA
jgi:hypothetical protein